MSKLSPEMLKLIPRQNQIVKDNNVCMFDPSTINTTITPSLIYPIPLSSAKEIHHHLVTALPSTLTNKLLFQPPNSYHLTINWFPKDQYSPTIESALIKSLDSHLNLSSINCQALSPFRGGYAIYASLDQDGQHAMNQNRDVASKIFSQHNLTPAVFKATKIAYISLARYVKPLTPEEINTTDKLETKTFNIELKEIIFALGNKFLTPKSRKIIHHWKLSNL